MKIYLMDSVKEYALPDKDKERFQRLQERLGQMDWSGMRAILQEA